jgi:hypothetical protein
MCVLPRADPDHPSGVIQTTRRCRNPRSARWSTCLGPRCLAQQDSRTTDDRASRSRGAPMCGAHRWSVATPLIAFLLVGFGVPRFAPGSIDVSEEPMVVDRNGLRRIAVFVEQEKTGRLGGGRRERSDPRASRFGACDRRAVTGDRRSQVRGVGRSLDDGIGPARRSIERESVVSVYGSEGNPDGDRTRACSRCAVVKVTAAVVV